MPRPTNALLLARAHLAEEGLRHCPACDADLPLSDFGRHNRKNGDGLQRKCRACTNAYNAAKLAAARQADPEGFLARRREEQRVWRGRVGPRPPEINRRNNLLKNYGITPEQFDEMLAHQGGACAICKRPLTLARGSIQSAHVDHDHATKAVRALLCAGCNVGVGAFGEDPDRLVAAARYLRKHKT